ARDAYDLHDLPSDFDGGLATFWLSHVPRARLRAFLDGFHARLVAGAVVYLADNVYVPGVGGELLPADRAGDTYKVRRLTDGGRHRVLKNYFSTEELRTVLAPGTSELAVRAGKWFWAAWCTSAPVTGFPAVQRCRSRSRAASRAWKTTVATRWISSGRRSPRKYTRVRSLWIA